jgi:hypothetical protein
MGATQERGIANFLRAIARRAHRPQVDGPVARGGDVIEGRGGRLTNLAHSSVPLQKLLKRSFRYE